MCRKSFHRIWVSSTASRLSYKGITTGFHLQSDYRCADSGSDGSSLLGWRHLHELADRLARLDFVDGHAVGVRPGDGGGGARPRRRVEGVQLLYQIVVLSHQIIERVVILDQDLRVHSPSGRGDEIRLAADASLECAPAQRLDRRELKGGRGRCQGEEVQRAHFVFTAGPLRRRWVISV